MKLLLKTQTTDLMLLLSLCKGCQFHSIKGCSPPKLQALGKESNGNTSLYVCKNQGQKLTNKAINSCNILTAEVLSNGNWKPVTPSDGIENVFKVEVKPALELKVSLSWGILLRKCQIQFHK